MVTGGPETRRTLENSSLRPTMKKDLRGPELIPLTSTQCLLVKYKVPGSSFGFSAPIIFETEGVDGEIMVGFGGAKTELMSKEEADQLFNQRAKKVKSRGDDAESAAEAAE